MIRKNVGWDRAGRSAYADKFFWRDRRSQKGKKDRKETVRAVYCGGNGAGSKEGLRGKFEESRHMEGQEQAVCGTWG